MAQALTCALCAGGVDSEGDEGERSHFARRDPWHRPSKLERGHGSLRVVGYGAAGSCTLMSPAG